MKSKVKYVVVLSALLLAFPAFAQPAKVEVKDPVVTKVEAKAPASAPVIKPDAKVEVSAKDTKKEEEKPATVAATDEDSGLSYGQVAIKYAMQLGFLLLSLLLSGFVTVLMKKFGFSAQTEKVNDVLMRAKGYAEQWALKKAKVDAAAKPGGPEKMEEAVCFALKLAKEYKLPQKGKDWWEEKLEAWLGVENGS